MTPYIAVDGTAVDLEHVLAIGPIITNMRFVEPYIYTIHMAFDTQVTISVMTRAEIAACHEKITAAWTTLKTDHASRSETLPAVLLANNGNSISMERALNQITALLKTNIVPLGNEFLLDRLNASLDDIELMLARIRR